MFDSEAFGFTVELCVIFLVPTNTKADMVQIASMGVNQLLSVVFSVATAYAAEVGQAVRVVQGPSQHAASPSLWWSLWQTHVILCDNHGPKRDMHT